MNRNKIIACKVTEPERIAIRHRARKSRMTVSGYMRADALDKEILVIEGLEQWLPQLGRIGNNLNQLTVILRTRNMDSPEFSQIKIEFQRLVETVTLTLQGRNSSGNYQDCERKVG